MLHQAKFHIGAAALSQLPRDDVREVAIAGRSNAGKSSAINALTNRRQLAFVSKTPGRTQQINYYEVGFGRFLVDLPGYGYARVPGALQQRWERLLSAYLQTRASLQGLVVVMDARHPMTDLDRQLLEWVGPTQRPVLVLLTKADKLSRQQQATQLASVEQQLRLTYPNCSVQLFSSTQRVGVAEARGFIERLLSGMARAPSESRIDAQRKAPGKGEKPGAKSLNKD
ncbi:MAG TPA: ribosome biogenesis GTP-binding protein YihA/YsxC [Burkholderiales bacterium]|nr:ribosome biogenesis GTP-binding protein YihA/YsxC [Burkholderiales bacterium]